MAWQGSELVKLPQQDNKVFESETIKIDGAAYTNCTFTRCKIIYCGGPTRLDSCSFSAGCAFEFQENAAYLLQTLSQMGWTLTPPDYYMQA
jgi:hypothetical protein